MRDRIIETVRVKASELVPNELNWREHGDGQREAMRAILGEVGYVDALMGVRLPDGRIKLINGHMRREESGDAVVPVNIVDLTEEEQRKVLATFDPIGELATQNDQAIASLLAGISTDSDAVEDLLKGLIKEAAERDDEDEVRTVVYEQAVQLRPEREYVVVMCANETEWDQVRNALGLKTVRRGGYKVGSAYDDLGIERVIPAARLLEAITKGEANGS